MNSIEWYIEKYPSELNTVEYKGNGRISIPIWLATYIYDKSGCKSKKRRIFKKVVSREFNRLLLEGLKCQ